MLNLGEVATAVSKYKGWIHGPSADYQMGDYYLPPGNPEYGYAAGFARVLLPFDMTVTEYNDALAARTSERFVYFSDIGISEISSELVTKVDELIMRARANQGVVDPADQRFLDLR